MKLTLSRDHQFFTVHGTAHRIIEDLPATLKAGKIIPLCAAPSAHCKRLGILFGRYKIDVKNDEDPDFMRGTWVIQIKPKDWVKYEYKDFPGEPELTKEEINRIKDEQSLFF